MSVTMAYMPPLVVDDGDVTVLRRMAAYTWGTYKVTWPEGFEPSELAPDRELGFVTKLPAPEGGRFSRRFVRADAQIDAANGYSNVEQNLDQAEYRTGGDVFFERDITTAGLGRLVPGVHFQIGDVVPVRIWGRVMHLPVTAIDEVSEPGNVTGYRVHVGGQLISDSASRESGNRELERTIAQERRERQRELGAVKETADDAQLRAKTINTSLTGDADWTIEWAVQERTGVAGELAKTADDAKELAGVMDLDLDQAVEIVAQGLDIEVPEGKETRMMFSIAQVLALAIQANQKAIQAETEARNLLEREATRMVWADAETAVRNDDVKLSNPWLARDTVIECAGDWQGMVVLHVVTEVVTVAGNIRNTFQRRWFVTPTARRFTHDNGIGPRVLHSTLFYQKWRPGTENEETINEA